MTRTSEREVARRLARRDEHEPPADLLARLKAEIPAEVRLGSGAEVVELEERSRRRGAPVGRRWLMAATLAAGLGGGLVGIYTLGRAPSMEETAAPEKPAVAARDEAFRQALPAPALPMPESEEDQDGAAGGGSSAVPGPPAPRAMAEPGRDAAASAESALEARADEAPAEATQPMSLPVEDEIDVVAETPPPAVIMREEMQAAAPAPASPQPLRRQSAAGKQAAEGNAAPDRAEDQAGAESGVPAGVVGGIAGGVAGGRTESRFRGDAPKASPATGAAAAQANDQSHGDILLRSPGVQPFVAAAETRLSTFGLDVDTGSYTEMRRHLRNGQLPPPESVRVEEYVNSFDYGDRPPARGDFALRVEGAPTPFAGGERSRLLRFSVRAREAEDRTGALRTVARDAQVRVEFDPRAVARYRLLGYDNRDTAGGRLRAERAAVGEIGAGYGVTALYEVELQPDAAPGLPVATLRLRYRSAESGEVMETERALTLRELAPSWEHASPALRLAATVAEFAEILRGSYRGASLDELSRRASALSPAFAGSSNGEDAAELARLIGRAAQLAAEGPPRP